MCDCALIVYLFKQDRSKAGFFIFFLAAACLLFWHGSKGAVVLPLLIFMSYLVHVRDRRFTLTHAAAGGGIALAMFALSFLLLSNSKEQVSLLSSMMSFSDYSRNAEMVIDSPPPKYPYLGRLELEQIIYARIPRLLMPNKPTVYGQFHLNDYYSPVQFYQDTGAGSYGIGTVYADFGPFSMLLLALEQGAAAYIAIGVLRLLLIQPTPGLFILLCYLCGMSVIPITESYIFPETLILGLVIDRCASLPWTLVWRRNALTPGP